MSHLAFTSTCAQKKDQRFSFAMYGRKKWLRAIAQPCLQIGSFILLSLSICFDIPSPYALSALTVLYLSGQKILYPLLGFAGGFLLRVVWGINLDIWQLAGCFVVLTLGYKQKNTMLRAALLTSFALLPRVVFTVLTAATVEQTILSILSIPLGIASLPAFIKLSESKSPEGSAIETQDHFLCSIFPLLLMMMGAARIMLFKLNIGYSAAAFFTLIASSMLGSGVGICAGLLCGLPVALSGHNAALMLCLSLGGMTAGLFRQKRRTLCAAVFMIAVPVAQYITMRGFSVETLVSVASAALIYIILPKRQTDLISQKLWCFMNHSNRESAFIDTELNSLANRLAMLSDALPEIEEPTLAVRDEAERIAASLCAGCERMPICFHDRYDKTIDLMQRLAGSGGYETVYHKIIQEGFLDCERAQNIPQIIEDMVERTNKAQQQAIRAQNEREMLKTHLSAISEQINKIKKRAYCANWSRDGLETQVEDVLRLLRIPARVLWAQTLDGQISIAVAAETPFSIKPPSDRLLRLLEHRFGVPLYFALIENNRLLIRQTPPIKLLSGFASITSAQSPADASAPPENGDAFLLREVSNGHLLIALSDGMGHGAEARKESRKTLEMLALCMHAGYQREQAMQAVNGMMLAAAQDERYATVDLCTLDCWTGMVVMNKLGACPSLLIQGRKIRRIVGETLPLGILSHVIPMEHTFMVGDGDLLLLMTDGITDAFGSEDALNQVLYRVLTEPPQIIADTLLQEALTVVDHRPKDDMSVLCMRIVDNEAAKLPRKRERNEKCG